MKLLSSKNCLGSYDLASYLSGTVYANEKPRIEQHLSVCDACFEVFIDILNQQLSVGEIRFAHALCRASLASTENSGAGATV